MQLVLEGGDDPKVTTAPAQPPEEVLVLLLPYRILLPLLLQFSVNGLWIPPLTCHRWIPLEGVIELSEQGEKLFLLFL